jgi:RimJ/RimL family protein N-acetyltransferase
MILKGEKVILRYPKVSEAKWLYENIIQPEVISMLGIFNCPPKNLKAEISWLRKQPAQRKKRESFNFIVLDKQTKELLGAGGLGEFNWQHRRGEAGLWLAKKYWKQGYGKDALKLILNFGFKNLKLNRIEGVCFEFNKKSRKLQESTGLKLEGILREHSFYKSKAVKHSPYYGKFVNDCFYSILRKEWKG